MLPVYICIAVIFFACISLCLLLFRLRRNIANVRDLFDRKLELERLARSHEVAAIWGTFSLAREEFQPISFSSQRGEDFHSWHLLGCPKNGFFMDVGAYDGVRGSNSYAMEQIGWRGILVEANPASVEKCKRLRPASKIIHAAIGGPDAKDTITFYTVEGNTDADMLSFIVSDDSHKEMCEKAGGIVREIEVPFRSLDSVLFEHASHVERIDILSVDIEGLELTALMGLNFERWAPRLIIAEANEVSLIAFLEKKGYRRAASVGANWLFMPVSDTENALHKPEFQCLQY